ncbi:unnamed protein product [Rotaria magnacalcarata]|uniref:Uncharacterized protein n=3 Tax=Rotaria magnacalcarata TaxID=392030 RepID=A0A816VPL9_9BILA|nr:unnamed protein product [Rotaria magnacalcarata]CAF1650431.1 unnamed protein product [Rotaria magnacalcarata]CAF2123287.1 unnamed protein product [Rotaria magnacalcarata]CAF3912850.1 unnamed protein product [Rotaria magnacalcarata]CAF3917536.1 unnamed protein product [Rotaria magnacalcarata]
MATAMALVAPSTDRYLCLSVMIYSYDRLKHNNNELLIVVSHYVFLAQGFIINRAPIGKEETLVFDHGNTRSYDIVTFVKDTMVIETKHSTDRRDYYLTLKIDDKIYNDFMHIATYLNQGRLLNANALVSHVMDFIKRSMEDHKKEKIAKATKDDQGKDEGGKGVTGNATT